MNICLSTTFIKDGEPLGIALDKCIKAKVGTVELGSNHCHQSNYNFISEYPLKYLVHNYFPIPEHPFVLNIASINNELRDKSINHIKKAIDFCYEHSAKLYTLHPGFLTDPDGSNKTDKNYDFVWNENKLHYANYNSAIKNMYTSLDIIINYAKKNRIKIAIETEGSFKKNKHLLMQKPEEFEIFKQNYRPSDIGINLNIGHLNLAANAFNFDRISFVKSIQEYILAMELSHNNGIEDQHLPLVEKSWYWDIILNDRYANTFKILEFRNIKINLIQQNIKLFDEKSRAISAPE
ncbi:sugar phosphate isomerase/epimerase [bacterium]|nr:sugar phosphate isomerase/epimerase [bacterium]